MLFLHFSLPRCIPPVYLGFFSDFLARHKYKWVNSVLDSFPKRLWLCSSPARKGPQYFQGAIFLHEVGRHACCVRQHANNTGDRLSSWGRTLSLADIVEFTRTRRVALARSGPTSFIFTASSWAGLAWVKFGWASKTASIRAHLHSHV